MAQFPAACAPARLFPPVRPIPAWARLEPDLLRTWRAAGGNSSALRWRGGSAPSWAAPPVRTAQAPPPGGHVAEQQDGGAR